MKKKCFFGMFLSFILLLGGVFLFYHTNNNYSSEKITSAYNNEIYFDSVYGNSSAGVSFKIEIGYANQNGEFKENTGTYNVSSSTYPSNSVLLHINPANWGSYRYRKCTFSNFGRPSSSGLLFSGDGYNTLVEWRADFDNNKGSQSGTNNFLNFSKHSKEVGAMVGVTWHFSIYWLVRLNLDANGGSLNDTDLIYATYQQCFTTSVPIPSRTGYTFQGYYTAKNGGNQWINSSGVINTAYLTRSTARPTTLYAHWTINSYKSDVNFYDPNNQQQGGTFDLYRKINGKEELLDDDANNEVGGEEWLQYNGQWILRDIQPNTGTHITSVSLSGGGTISVTGTAPNITEIIYTANQTYAPKPNWDGTVNIYTAWNTYKVRYNANGGSGTMTDQSFTYNTAQNLKSNTFKRAGYYFTGWNGNGTNYTNGQSVINLTTTHNSTIDFYAQWEPNTYSVLLDQNGGTGGTTSVSAIYDRAMPSITVPMRTGYTFLGYYDTNGKQYYTPSGDSANIWDKAVAEDDVITLYARWQVNTYTTTLNDGTGAVTNFADMLITNYNYTYSSNEYCHTVNGVTITYENGTGTLTLNGTPTNAFTIFINTDLSFKQNEQYSVKYTKQEGSMTGGGTGCFVLEICDENWANLSTRNHLDFQMNASSGEAKLTVNESGETNGKGLRLWFWFNANATPARVFNNFKIKITLEKLGENQSVIKTGKVTYDSQLRGVSIPSKIGYTFSGYYNSQSGGKQYYKATGVAITEIWKETNNINLYAQWTANTYTINYNLGDDDTYPANLDSNAPTSATYNVAIKIPTPTRVGYVFVGWTLSGDNISTAQSGASDTSLSAWDGGANRNRYFKNLTPDASGSVTMTATWKETIASSSITAKMPAKDSNNEYYLISNIDNLAWLALQGDKANVTGEFRQTNNITIPNNILWLPIGRLGSFSGTYDGQGYTISGLRTYDGTDANRNYLETNGGLFANASGAKIKNVIIEDATIYGQNAGIIAGSGNADTNISNCVVSGSVNGTSIGSIIGNGNGATITSSLAYGVNTSSIAGGSASIDSCIYELSNSTRGASDSFNNYSAWIYPSNFTYPMPKAFMWYPAPELTEESLNTWLNR